LDRFMMVKESGSRRAQIREVFSGSGVLTAAWRAAGLSVAEPFDLANGADQDFMTNSELRRWLSSDSVSFVWFAPPCTTYSMARTTAPVSRKRSQGNPFAPPDDLDGVEADRLMARLARCCLALHRRGVRFVIEHPWTAVSWYLPCMGALLSEPGISVHRVDYCCYGTKYQKPTCLMTNVGSFVHLRARCACSPPHAERLTGCKTRRAASYPPQLVQAVTRLLQFEGLGCQRVSAGSGSTPGPAWLEKRLLSASKSRVSVASESRPCLSDTPLPGQLSPLWSRSDPSGKGKARRGKVSGEPPSADPEASDSASAIGSDVHGLASADSASDAVHFTDACLESPTHLVCAGVSKHLGCFENACP